MRVRQGGPGAGHRRVLAPRPRTRVRPRVRPRHVGAHVLRRAGQGVRAGEPRAPRRPARRHRPRAGGAAGGRSGPRVRADQAAVPRGRRRDVRRHARDGGTPPGRGCRPPRPRGGADGVRREAPAGLGVTSPPGALLVHGLWHGAWCWDDVRAALADRGVDSAAVELPLGDLDGDVRATRDALEAFGRPAVLVGHSYGGAVVTAAGVHPLVRELVYLAAHQLDVGESVSRPGTIGELPDTRLGEALRVVGDEVELDADLGVQLLYGDALPEVAASCAARLRPAGRLVFRGAPEQVAWRTVPSTYVVCAGDQVVHPDRQRAMARRATRTLEWSCGHSPAATRPAAVAQLIADRVRAITTG
ncbi:alpha/beta fold hydrolase [Geodermatophilaceae bacterium NBWT11]|nr:alpha/beta fold hydrolase [Geodermatophilaceae bacterium NBWT11]